MTKILVIGHGGQVAWELRRTLAPLGRVLTAAREQGDLRCDLAKQESVAQVIHQVQPDLIVNAGAYTDVERAETEVAQAIAINGLAPGIVGEMAQKVGASVIHFSTDFVFDGHQDQPYQESDPTNPLCVYGRSKCQGEINLAQACDRHLIFRTSWVYGMRGKNFLKTMVRLGQERDQLTIVSDQRGTPTWSRAIAEGIAQIVAQGLPNLPDFMEEHRGIYHLTPQGDTTWFEFAQRIFHSEAFPSAQPPTLIPIATQDYPCRAARPLYSVLNTQKLAQTFGLQLPHWQTLLDLATESPQ